MCVVQHTPCAGIDTRLTESYTDELASAIHVGFANFCKRIKLESFTSEGGAAQPSACAVGIATADKEPLPGDAGGALRPTGGTPVKNTTRAAARVATAASLNNFGVHHFRESGGQH